MSLTAERPPVQGAVGCERCGAALEHDQEWCLECGSARTLIHRPPDWRVPAAIVGVVVALVVAVLVVVLIRLSADANRLAAEQSAKPAPTTTASQTTAAPSPRPTRTATTPAAPASNPSVAAGATAGQIASWPVGLGGWTVVLYASSSRANADAVAKQVAAKGTLVGLLNSSQHPRLTPGLWVVFSGRYPTAAAASAATLKLQAKGHPSAHIRLVGPPGGA